MAEEGANASSSGSFSAHSSRDKAFEIFVKRTITSIQKEAWGRSKEVKEIREACQAFLNSLEQTGGLLLAAAAALAGAMLLAGWQTCGRRLCSRCPSALPVLIHSVAASSHAAYTCIGVLWPHLDQSILQQ